MMKNSILYLSSLLASIATLLSLTSCSTPTRRIASAQVQLTAADIQCYRDVQKQKNNSTDFPWGFDGPVVMAIGEAWTERYGTSDEYDAQNKHAIVKWYPQFGSRYALVDGDMKLMVEMPPYSTAGMMKSCPNSEDNSVDLVEILGKRYLISSSGAGFFTGVYDSVTQKSLSPDRPDQTVDACLLKESRRQTLQYKGWEKDIQNHGAYVIQVNLEGKTPILPAQSLSADQIAPLTERLGASLVSALRGAADEYRIRVKAQKARMRVRTQAPYFEEDTVPPLSDDLLKKLDVASCDSSPNFQSHIESIRKQIKDCSAAYAHLHLDCTQ